MKARRLILIVLATIGVIGFLASFVLFYVLEDTSPSKPVVVAHQVFQMNNHGYMFYVTQGQYWLFYGLLVGGWSLAALAAVLNFRWKVIHNLTPRGWRLPE